MGRSSFALAMLTTLAVAASAADDPLAKARLFYNQRQFDAAVTAAEQARLVPSRADAADLVAARAYLERFRESEAPDDLASGRERLRRLDPKKLAPRERAEYIIGLGEALFFDGSFGAASDVFDSVLLGAELTTGESRERVIDWWAAAVDREAKPRADADRPAAYQRMRSRMQEELAAHPASGAASYWLAAAARSQGDSQAAWDAAQAGWVRAPLATDRGVALRADLDRLVLRAILPDRAKATAQSPETLRIQWEQFKQRWQP
jgi:hypothetical protein